MGVCTLPACGRGVRRTFGEGIAIAHLEEWTIRILLVAFYFPPSSAVGALRAGRLARLLPRHGFSVDVVCAADGDGFAVVDPTVGGEPTEESSVRRIPAPLILGRDPVAAPPRRRPFKRVFWKLRAYVESLFLTRSSAWAWGRSVAEAVEGELERGAYDALLVTVPPWEYLGPLVAVARRAGVPVIGDLRDPWRVELIGSAQHLSTDSGGAPLAVVERDSENGSPSARSPHLHGGRGRGRHVLGNARDRQASHLRGAECVS